MRAAILLFVIATLTSCSSNPPAFDAGKSDIAPGHDKKSTLALHKADTFHLGLGEKAYVSGYADQLTVDVAITVLGPDNKQILNVDGPNRGPENFQFTTQVAGTHKLVVAPFKDNVGDYTLHIGQAEALATDPAKRIDQLMAGVLQEDGPGAAVAVARDGKIIFSKGYGHADLEYDIHNTPQTIFHIASVSKQFTAFSIALLADQGKLSVDDDIRKYLPELHDFGTPITIRHLIHHTSGLRDQWNLLVMAGWREDDVITRQQIMRMISRQRELNTKPGTEFNYCNTGYTLLAEIVSRVTGKTFPQWTKENIFLPLGMKNSQFYDDHEKIVPNRAYSYYRADTTFKKSVLSYSTVGATSLFTTVEDLSRWAMNFENIKVGNASVMAMMELKGILNNGDTLEYAFGQDIYTYKGLKAVSHGGADAGYRSFLLRFPQQRFSVSLFSNLPISTGRVSHAIADAYLADLIKEEPKKAETPQPEEPVKESFDASSVKLSDYTGRFYSDELETFYDFEVRNDTLVAHHQRHDDFKLTPVKADGFNSTAWWMGDIQFTRVGGKVTGLRVSNGRVVNLAFRKM